LEAGAMKNPAEVDYRLKWRAMTAVGVGVFLATVDGSIINVSLPTLVRSLDTEFAVVQWVVLGYLLTITTSMLSIGRVADIVGKKSMPFGTNFAKLLKLFYIYYWTKISKCDLIMVPLFNLYRRCHDTIKRCKCF
jgi:MFS family permease